MKNKWLVICAVMMPYFLASATGLISPALENLAKEYPSIPFTNIVLLGSLPSLFAIPTAVLTGTLVGQKISFRKTALIGSGLMAVGGFAPYIFPAFTAIIVARAVFGLGYGVCLALLGVLVIRLFEGQTQANLLGTGSIVLAGSGIVFPLLAGALVDINTSLVWVVHLIAALAFLIFFFGLPEPKKAEVASVTQVKEKTNIPFSAWALLIAYGLGTMSMYPLFLGSSTIVLGENLGNAAMAGLVLSAYFAGGLVGGFTFGRFFKLTGKLGVGLAYFLSAFGIALAAFGHSLPLLYAGAFLNGVGFVGFVQPGTMANLGRTLSPAGMAVAGGLFGALSNVGGFVTPYWMALLTKITGLDSPRVSLWGGAIVLVILGVWFTVTLTRSSHETKPASDGVPDA
ncbi:MAG: MFS transporter [Methanobacterium sp.]